MDKPPEHGRSAEVEAVEAWVRVVEAIRNHDERCKLCRDDDWCLERGRLDLQEEEAIRTVFERFRLHSSTV